MRFRNVGVAIATVGLISAARDAAAQTVANPFKGGFALQQFDPAPTGDRFFGVADGATNHVHFGVQAIGNYALKPLTIVDRATGEKRGDLTKDQLYAHLNMTVGLWKRVLLNVDVPFALVQGGDNVNGIAKLEGGKIGDVKVGARVNIYGGWKDPFSVGVQGDAWLPTGDKNALTGDQRTRGAGKVVVSGKIENFVYAANAGFITRRHIDLGTPEIGNALTFGAAAGVLLADEHLQIGPEIYGNSVFQYNGSDTPFLGRHSTPVEAVLGVKGMVGDFVIGAAAGPGLTKAPGTPQLRALLSVAYVARPDETPPDRDHDGIPDAQDACPDTPGVPDPDPKKNGCPPAPSDRDGDGIPDSVDACPDTPGVPDADPKKNGCPPDRDGDGIPDNVDACPDTPGVPSDDPKKNGCPPDRDGDGIPDAEDACPDTPGVKNSDPKKNGCPPDRDGDGIPDSEDACPDTPGVKDPDPKKNGCPPLAFIDGKQIKISEQVHFAFNKATILPDSDRILEAVAAILKDHQEIKQISVDGHTDNVGNKNYNKTLSKNRAEAVKKWLSTKGSIEKVRLVAKGFGQEKPVKDNDTDEGRAANRRVELNIVKEGDANEPAKGGAKKK